MKRQSTSKLLRLMVAVFALFLLVMAGSVLSACGGEVQEQPNNAEVHKHTYGQPTHQAIAKCGSTGYDVYECTVCGDRYAIVTAATGEHDFEKGVCKVCGISIVGYDDTQIKATLKDILDKVNENVGTVTEPEKAHTHTFTKNDKLTLKASCLSAGVEIGVCECGSQAVMSWTPATQHTYAPAEAKEGEVTTRKATCTLDGQVLMRCTVCHDEYWAVNTDDLAKGHNFQRSKTELDKPANCITPKLLAYKCTNPDCGEIQYQQLDNVLDSTRHSDIIDPEAEGYANSFVTEWTVWEETDEDAPSLPEGVTVKSTVKWSYGTCPACGATVWKSESKPCEHEWQPLKEVIARTCEEDGWFNAYCEKCDSYANQAPQSVSAEGVYTFDESKVGELGEGDDPEKLEAHKHLYKYEKTGHDYSVTPVEKYEVDRDEDGNLITKSENGKSANTTSWMESTCVNCGQKLALATLVGEKYTEMLSIADYVPEEGEDKNIAKFYHDKYYNEYVNEGKANYLKEHTDKTEATIPAADLKTITDKAEEDATALARKFFPREWHSWTLYNPELDETTHEPKNKNVELENGDHLTPPENGRQPLYETCIEGGEYWYYCVDTSCSDHRVPTDANQKGRWITIEHDPIGHNWGTPTVTKAPTCTQSGIAEFTCTNKLADGSTCNAKITVSITEAGYNAIVTGENFWDAMYHYKDASNTATWDDAYIAKWYPFDTVLKIVPATKTDGSADPHAGSAQAIYNDLVASGQLDKIVKAVMPQAHLWVEDTEETAKHPAPKCFDGHIQYWKCECTDMTGCHDGSSECAKWAQQGDVEHIKKDGKVETGTYIIYGKDYSERDDRFNIEVTYCKNCGLELSRRVLVERNYKHFPFNRKTIEALIEGYVPAFTETRTEEKVEGGTIITIVRDYAGAEKDYMSDAAIAARKEYANVWISIQKYWYEDNMDEQYEANLFEYLYTKGMPKDDSHFTIFCNDCFNAEFDFVVTEDHPITCGDDDFDSTEAVRKVYAFDPAKNAYIEVTDATKETYNSCEYVYFEQYEKTCKTCGFTIRSATKDGKGVNRYTRLTKTADGEYIEPTGTHYLVPAYQYWTHKNYKVNEDKSVTMDWICALCGKTFERTVQYAVPATTTEEAAPETTAKVFADVDPDENLILLVDLHGVLFNSELNQSEAAKKTEKLQINNVIYYGAKLGNTDGLDYVVNAKLVLRDGSTGAMTIQINNGSQTYSVPNRKMSLIRADEFIDVNTKAGKEEYESIWAERYSAEKDADHKKIAALLNEGGEILLGGDVEVTESFNVATDTTIDLNGHKLKGSLRLNAEDVDLVIDGQGATYDATTGAATAVDGTIEGTLTTVSHGNITVRNATINATSGTPILFAPESDESGTKATKTDSVITLENVVVTSKTAAICSNGLADGGKLIMNNCTVISDNASGSAALWISGETTVEATNCEFYSQWQTAYIVAGESKFDNCIFVAGKHTDNIDTGAWTTNGNTTPKEAEAVFVIVAKGGNYGTSAKVEFNSACQFKLAKDDVAPVKKTTGGTGEVQLGDSGYWYADNVSTATDKNTKKLISINAWRDGAATLTLDAQTATNLDITKDTAKNFCGVWDEATATDPITIVIGTETVKVTKDQAALKHAAGAGA